MAKRVQHHTTSLQSKRNVVSYNICLVKKFDCDQTSYNKIQHDTTRYNKVAKRVQHFIQHQSCMMLYEMLYSFGLGLKVIDTVGFLSFFSKFYSNNYTNSS